MAQRLELMFKSQNYGYNTTGRYLRVCNRSVFEMHHSLNPAAYIRSNNSARNHEFKQCWKISNEGGDVGCEERYSVSTPMSNALKRIAAPQRPSKCELLMWSFRFFGAGGSPGSMRIEVVNRAPPDNRGFVKMPDPPTDLICPIRCSKLGVWLTLCFDSCRFDDLGLFGCLGDSSGQIIIISTSQSC